VNPTPDFVRLPPDPPDFLDGEALAEWHRVVPELVRLKLLCPLHRSALVAYCETWQRLVDAQALIAKEGLLHTNSQGVTRHPAVAIAEAASRELRAWAGEFGLTPSAENRVASPVPAKTSGSVNPFG
jgi:P27 family predicted phage terminase small subunit